MPEDDDPSAAGAGPGVTPALVGRREFLVAGARALQQIQTIRGTAKASGGYS